MSKNSKNAQRTKKAREIADLHLKGEKGPAKTAPKHGKKNAWWQKFPSYGAFLRGGKKDKPAEAS